MLLLRLWQTFSARTFWRHFVARRAKSAVQAALQPDLDSNAQPFSPR